MKTKEALCEHVSAKYKQRRPLSAENILAENGYGETESRHGLQSRKRVTAFVRGQCRIIIEIRKHLKLCFVLILIKRCIGSVCCRSWLLFLLFDIMLRAAIS